MSVFNTPTPHTCILRSQPICIHLRCDTSGQEKCGKIVSLHIFPTVAHWRHPPPGNVAMLVLRLTTVQFVAEVPTVVDIVTALIHWYTPSRGTHKLHRPTFWRKTRHIIQGYMYVWMYINLNRFPCVTWISRQRLIPCSFLIVNYD